jgi:hypothetical protein
MHAYEICPSKDHRGGYAMHRSGSHDAVIRVYDEAGQRDRDARAEGRVQRVVICSSISFPMIECTRVSYRTAPNRKYNCKMRKLVLDLSLFSYYKRI